MEHEEYQWIFWSDADSIITNLAISLEDLIDEDYDLIITKSADGIDTGEFLIRNCEWSRQLLVDIYNHVECIIHPSWDRQALILHLQQNPELYDRIKVLPQRLMNSHIEPAELTVAYQRGDFIVHFSKVHDLGRLSNLFEQYNRSVINDLSPINLDYYLDIYGFDLRSPEGRKNNEGYITQLQRDQFNAWLAAHPDIESIVEIGLGAGYSADNFLRECKQLKQFASFDINQYAYTKPAADFFRLKYRDIFNFHEGDSAVTIPEFAAVTTQKFDLIYVDGRHVYETCLNDILNCQMIAREGAYIWVDDYNQPDVQKAVQECINSGIIAINGVYESNDDGHYRLWVDGVYLTP
jgi:predicted O-methyltransferase YrrM